MGIENAVTLMPLPEIDQCKPYFYGIDADNAISIPALKSK